MIVRKSQAYTIAGGKVNEDLYRQHENCVWVLDGSSGLGEHHISSSPSDAVWFVSEIDKNLLALYDEVTPLQKILAQAVQQVANDYQQLVRNKALPPYEYPSCSIAFIRLTNVINYLVLGDITLALKMGEDIEVITDTSVSRLDDQVISALNHYRRENQASFEEAKRYVRPLLQQNRALMNKEGGYWVLGLDATAVDHALVGTISLKGSGRLLLASDGFARLIDLYKLFDDWSHLFRFIAANSLKSTIDMLRRVEAEDLNCLHYPRFKPSDDVTAVYLSFVTDK